MINFLINVFEIKYNYFFPSFNVLNEINVVREQVSQENLENYARELDLSTFRKDLLQLIGVQNEDEAIKLVLKTYLLLTEHHELITQLVDCKEFLDFSSPLPTNSLSNGRSFEALVNLLVLSRLSIVFLFISDNRLQVK